MLRLRSCILTCLRSSPATSPVPPLHRLLSAAASAPTASPNPSFAVEDYLVDTCGLTRPQALKASAKLSHLKPPTNPDAVLGFLAGLGLSSADVAAAIAKDPQLLCVNVEKTLAPIIVGLTGHGLSHTEIARLVSLGRAIFRCRSVVSNLPYFLSLFSSYENLLRFLKHSSSLLGCSLEKVIKPIVAFLRKCGLGDCDISKLCLSSPRLLSANPECVQAMVACAEGLGVPRGSAMFRHALHAVAFLSEEKIAAQVENLKNTFRWSDAEIRSEFLISKVGLEPAYIAQRPAMLCYSLEGRLKPRYYVVKFLKENGLLDRERSYYSAFIVAEKAFMKKYIIPHNEAAPHLAEDYATACRGEVPARFISA